ncbi:MAG: EamA family transporter RarD [Oceanipulchritudo sp.]
MMSLSTNSRGLVAIILAYTVWGLFPIYWKGLGPIDPLELLLARLILTAGACLLVLRYKRSLRLFLDSWRQPRRLAKGLLAATLLSGNWFSFIWAVGNERVLESSLGYFLCPLASVLLGRILEKETLGPRRWFAVALSAAGVGLIVLQAGRLPLAALTIALTWSSYGLVKKRSRIGPVLGLGLETSLLSPLAAGALWILFARQESLSLIEAESLTLGLLALAGFLTATPLLLFAYAAQRIRLSTMGMGQYIVPSAHFGLAVAYGEAITLPVLAGFALIWLALLAYSLNPPGCLPEKKRPPQTGGSQRFQQKPGKDHLSRSSTRVQNL